MFVSYFKSSSRPLFDTLSLAVRATFQPTKTGAEIALGSPEDFNMRVKFFLKVFAIALAAQAAVAWQLGISVWPKSMDALSGVLSPLLGITLFLAIYAPIRLFRGTKLPFSQYFQAAATAQGAGLFMLPINLLPAILVSTRYGQLQP